MAGRLKERKITSLSCKMDMWQKSSKGKVITVHNYAP